MTDLPACFLPLPGLLPTAQENSFPACLPKDGAGFRSLSDPGEISVLLPQHYNCRSDKLPRHQSVDLVSQELHAAFVLFLLSI